MRQRSCFLPREPQTGMGEQSEANSSFETSTIRRLQDTQQIQFSAFTFHLSPQTEMGEQSEANSSFETKTIRRLQDTQQIQFSAFTFHLSPQTEMGEQSEANSSLYQFFLKI